MAPLQIETPLCVATINVRGFKNDLKCMGLLSRLKKEKLDILSIQETHLVTEVEIDALSARWGGIVHHSPGSNRSKGVATLFDAKYTDNVVFIKSYDRIVFSKLRVDSENILIY